MGVSMSTTNKWGSSNFKKSYREMGQNVSLQEIVDNFPAALKQAMFAAASTRNIARRTWNGCAMNAAGMEIGKGNSVTSFDRAAQAFGISPASVKQFIKVWDGMGGTDEYCTQVLRETIEKAGLFTEPGDRQPRIIKMKVYEDQQKKLREQFDKLMKFNAIPGTDLMEEVLSTCI